MEWNLSMSTFLKAIIFVLLQGVKVMRAHLCASLLHISEVTKLYSFVSAVKARGHMKLIGRKISSVTYPEFVTIHLYMWDPRYMKKDFLV